MEEDVIFLQRGWDAICSLMGERYWITTWRPNPREKRAVNTLLGAQHNTDPYYPRLLLLLALSKVVNLEFHFITVEKYIVTSIEIQMIRFVKMNYLAVMPEVSLCL